MNRDFMSRVPGSARISDSDLQLASLKARALALDLELIEARRENEMLRSALVALALEP